MDTRILKHLLSYNFYDANKHKLAPSLFEDETRELYELLEKAHDKYHKDISGPDLLALWKIDNPVAVRAKLSVIDQLIQQIEHEQPYLDEVAGEVIAHLWQRENGRKIAEIGLAISEGKKDALYDLQKLLDKTKDGMPNDWGDPVTDDLEELLALTGDESRYRFNILSLNRHVYGMGKGEFGVIFARPEKGKSAFGISIACADGGFLSQGARVFIGGNEEDARRTMLRAFQAISGMSREDLNNNPHKAYEAYKKYKGQLIIRNIQEWSIYDLDRYLDDEKFDVVIIDQLDKLKLPGGELEGHARLRAIYTEAREIAKRRDCALFGVCQASVEAEGKTVLDYSMMEGSKTGKAAESDLIIGIGSFPDTEDGIDPTRIITVSKNKLSGWHGQVTCMLDAPISTYRD